MKTTKFIILAVGLVGLLTGRSWAATNNPSADARFHDWQALGCHQPLAGSQTVCTNCETDQGMARWWVEEPYINLFVSDEPLSYFMTSGQRMSFRWNYKQRYQLPYPDQCPNFYYPAFDPGAPRSQTDPWIGYMRTWGMTNAAWSHNWMMDIVFWDQMWESNTVHYGYGGTVFSGGYEALVFRPDGGVYYFNNVYNVGALTDPLSQGTLQPLAAYPEVRSSQSQDTNGYYLGDAGMGFKILYADGSQDIFGLVAFDGGAGPGATNSPSTSANNSTAHAFLTQRIDPQGRVTRVGYGLTNSTTGISGFRVRYVVDPDLRTNTFLYSPSVADIWQLSQISNTFGLSASFGYDYDGRLSGIEDAAGNLSTFGYDGSDGSGWMTNLTTPYGTTSFSHYQNPAWGGTNGDFSQRALYTSEPMGAQQLFCYLHSNGVPATAQGPTTVTGQVFDNGSSGTSAQPWLNYRDSFHWDRLQFTALSSNATRLVATNLSIGLAALSASDLNKGRQKHWLWQTDQLSISEAVSSEQEPSWDAAGQIPGPRTWYNYPRQLQGCDTVGNPGVQCAALVLPDGTSQYTIYSYYLTKTAPLAGQVQFSRASCALPNGTLGELTNWFGYASNGIDLVSMTNSGGQWLNLGWNTNHQVTFLTNALNQVTSLGWDPGTHNLTGVGLPSGQNYTLSYSGYLGSIGITPPNLTIDMPVYAGCLPQQVHIHGSGGPDLWTTNAWDNLNRLTGVAFQDGSTISNIYTVLDLTAQKDRVGNWTYYNYDGLEHLEFITNALKNVTHLSWCGCGSLTSIQDPVNPVPTTFNYNNQGLLTNVGFPDLSAFFCQYDAAQRLNQVTNASGNGFTCAYNNQGLVTAVNNAFGAVWTASYDLLDRASVVANADSVSVTYAYDLLNRVTSRVWNDGIGDNFVWATNGLAAYTNRDGKVTVFSRDGAGRLIGVTNANHEVTALAYNAADEITQLWDARMNQTAWFYNQYALLAYKTDARGATIGSWLYDPNGRVTNRWTPQFTNTAYGYDPLGNLASVLYSNATGTSVVSYYYDALNRLTNMVDAAGGNYFGYTGAGQLASEYGRWTNDSVTVGYSEQLRQALSLEQPGGTYWNQTYGYDNALRLQTVTAPAGVFGYGYGSANPASALVRSVSLPNWASVTNHYDALDRLDYTGLQNLFGHELDGYGYSHDALGLRTNLTRYLGITSNSVAVGYDGVGQVVSWSGKEGGGGLRQNEQLGFGFDAAHNLSARTSGGLSQAFSSDILNQLTNVTRTGTLTVSGTTPVPATNVTVNGQAAQTNGDFTFASANMTLTNNGSNTFTVVARNIYGQGWTNVVALNLPVSVSLQYDGNGNLTNDGTRAFACDAENRLASVSVANGWRSDFVYDGLSRRRIERDYGWQGGGWVETNETHVIYDGLVAIQERNSNSAPQTVTYTRGLDLSGSLQYAGGIGGLLARTDGNGTTYYHADGAGNVTLLVDGNGNMAARYLYGAFGRVTAQWGWLSGTNTMQFSSMPRHGNSGLSLFMYRGYDPALQRFITRDPIGEMGGVNLYGFVRNNALSWADPFGLDNMYNMQAGNNAPPSLGFVGPVNHTYLAEPVPMGGDDILGLGGMFMNYVPGLPFAEGLLGAPFNIYSGIRDAANPYLDPLNRWAGGLNAFGNTVLLAAPAALKGKPCPSNARGWRVGDPINNLTSKGNVPTWDTVRERFWKNEAVNNGANYSADNLARMQEGLAPQRVNPVTGDLESMELHHDPAQASGGLFDFQAVWPDEHAAIDPFRRTGN